MQIYSGDNFVCTREDASTQAHAFGRGGTQIIRWASRKDSEHVWQASNRVKEDARVGKRTNCRRSCLSETSHRQRPSSHEAPSLRRWLRSEIQTRPYTYKLPHKNLHMCTSQIACCDPSCTDGSTQRGRCTSNTTILASSHCWSPSGSACTSSYHLFVVMMEQLFPRK